MKHYIRLVIPAIVTMLTTSTVCRVWIPSYADTKKKVSEQQAKQEVQQCQESITQHMCDHIIEIGAELTRTQPRTPAAMKLQQELAPVMTRGALDFDRCTLDKRVAMIHSLSAESRTMILREVGNRLLDPERPCPFKITCNTKALSQMDTYCLLVKELFQPTSNYSALHKDLDLCIGHKEPWQVNACLNKPQHCNLLPSELVKRLFDASNFEFIVCRIRQLANTYVSIPYSKSCSCTSVIVGPTTFKDRVCVFIARLYTRIKKVIS